MDTMLEHLEVIRALAVNFKNQGADVDADQSV